MHKKKNIFVTFEGIEGSGKSYQSKKLYKNIKAKKAIEIAANNINNSIKKLNSENKFKNFKKGKRGKPITLKKSPLIFSIIFGPRLSIW